MKNRFVSITLWRNSRKTGPVSSVPPKDRASSYPVWRHASVPFALSTIFGASVALASPAPFQAAATAQSQEQAVPAQSPIPDPNRQIRTLAKRLNLTADQQNQILPILNDRARQIETLRSDNSLSAGDRHAKVQAVRQDADSRISAILTPDQKQAYEQLEQQARERARQRHREKQNSSQGAANAG